VDATSAAFKKMKKSKIKNQNFISKAENFKFTIVILLFTFLILNFSGCATVSRKEVLPTYSIDGAAYLPLSLLCERLGVNFDYDTFSKTVTLSNHLHKINLMIGQTLVIVDGLPQHLRHRVDFYQGMVVVPFKFKEQILDVLFKESGPNVKNCPIKANIKKIVVDAGHGGVDPGTTGRSGLREKSINLDIANRLSKLLRNDGIDVVMTRSSDNFISLQRRVDIANQSKADLFVSIHTNANRVRSLNGFEVYYVSSSVNDAKRALSAATDAVLNIDKSCFNRMTLDLKATLWDMIYTYGRSESVDLAKSICQTVKHDLNVKILGVKGAGFYVLKGAQMPAVLVEIGFLSNNNEERLLKNTYYRQQIADAIAQGIRGYASDCALAEATK